MLVDCLFILRRSDVATTSQAFHQVLMSHTEDLAALREQVQAAFGIAHANIFYTDDEGDEIRVCTDGEAAEAFRVAAASSGSITFYVDVAPVEAEEAEEEAEAVEAPVEECIAEEEVPLLQEAREAEAEAEAEAEEQRRSMEVHLEIPGSAEALKELLSKGCDNIMARCERFISSANPTGLPVDVVDCWVEHSDGSIDRLGAEAPEQAQESEAEPERALPQSAVIHTRVLCDGCDHVVRGIRYKCANCRDYDLCEACEATNLAKGTHNADHVFMKIYKPVDLGHRRMPCLYANKGDGCGRRANRWARMKQRRAEVDGRIASLETLCETLAAEVAILKEEREASERASNEEVQEQVVEEEQVVVEEEQVVEEKSLLEQSMAGLTPEAMVAFDVLTHMGFTDYPLIGLLLRQHKCNIQQVVDELIAARK